jgi:hypothetical protein
MQWLHNFAGQHATIAAFCPHDNGEPAAMTTIKRFKNCRIAVFRDHAPPHFHVIGTDETEAVVDLTEMTVCQGDARKFREALDWATANRSEITAVWNALNRKG